MSIVLGLNDPWHDSNFCINSPGGMIHVELERFTRSKYEQLNPVLGFIGLYPDLIESIEGFAIEEGEFLAPHVRRLISIGDAGIEEFICQIANQPIGSIKLGTTGGDSELNVLRSFAKQLLRHSASISFYGHHLCHAANALFSSNFSEALSVTLDGGGLEVIDGKRTTVHGSVWKLNREERSIPSPLLLETDQSIGLAWDRVRKIVGLREGEEGTVMAMAAFGKPAPEMEALVGNDLLWAPMSSELPKPRARSLEDFVRSVAAATDSEEKQFDLAAALQKETEVRIRRFLAPYLESYCGDLCLSGGVFLNCQAAGKIRSWFPEVREIYIPPAPYDGGIGIGAAQLFLHCCGSGGAIPESTAAGEFAGFATGRTYSRIEITGAVRAHGCAAHQAGLDEVARLLDDGAVMGLFQGAAESGRRALGHRSIIADPRRTTMKERINSLVKHRQWFRPFAPMVLAEQTADWFEIEPGFASPYMSFAVPVRMDKRPLIPAVVHQDGTARVQTVHPNLTPKLHHLLRSWQERSGIPLLLNTSFNDREPIVQQPSEALATFLRLPIDGIYFADFEILVVRKPMAIENIRDSSPKEKADSPGPVGRLVNWLKSG